MYQDSWSVESTLPVRLESLSSGRYDQRVRDRHVAVDENVLGGGLEFALRAGLVESRPERLPVCLASIVSWTGNRTFAA